MPTRVKGSPKAAVLVALSIVLIVALSACGGSDKPTSGDATSTPNAAPSDAKPDTDSQGLADGLGLLQQRPVQHALGRREDHERQRRAAQARVDAPADGQEPVRRLRLDPGHRRRRDLLAGPRVQRRGHRLKSGEVLWSKKYDSPDQGPNGLVVGGGRVFGATAEAAFALDQKTGKEIWSEKLIRNDEEGIDMTPGYHHGMVYVSTVPGQQHQVLQRGHQGHPLGAGRQDGQARLELRHRADEDVVQEEHPDQPRRRPLARARRSTARAASTSASATPARGRATRSTRGARAARAATCTPTRWSSSTPRPAS